jgi:hypothetical protein
MFEEPVRRAPYGPARARYHRRRPHDAKPEWAGAPAEEAMQEWRGSVGGPGRQPETRRARERNMPEPAQAQQVKDSLRPETTAFPLVTRTSGPGTMDGEGWRTSRRLPATCRG